MHVIRRADLAPLLTVRGPCASLYLPLHPQGREGEADPVRLREALDSAARQLRELGHAPGDIEAILAPARELPRSERWRSRGDALAILLAPDVARFERLDSLAAAEVWGDNELHVRALLPHVVDSDRFLVLALSQHDTRLFEGDADELRPLDVPGLASHIDEALNIDSTDRGQQSHSASNVAAGKQAAVFHGQGGKADRTDTDRRAFMAQAAAAIDRRLSHEQAPLLLACVAEHEPLWRDVSQYRHILPTIVAGNPDRMSLVELHHAAWERVAPHLLERRRGLYGRLCDAKGTTRVVHGIAQVLPAALEGKVELLFADTRVAIPGAVEVAAGQGGPGQGGPGKIHEHSERQERDTDLLNRAILETLRHRGDAVARPAPKGAPIVEALLRY